MRTNQMILELSSCEYFENWFEHIDLVAEFREEYLEAVEDAGEDSFSAGLLFPALAWVEGTPIGPDQIVEYLNQIPVLS